MKVMTTKEALEVIKGRTLRNGNTGINRFNKKNFNILITALLNDPDFEFEVSKIRKGELVLEKIMPTKEFRKWCKKLLEKTGMDKKDAEIVMDDNFVIDNVEGLYEFFTSAIYTFMEAGNKFDLPTKKDFKGSIYLRSVPKKSKVMKQYSPKDRTFLGTFETTRLEHTELGVKSNCPKYLRKRKKV